MRQKVLEIFTPARARTVRRSANHSPGVIDPPLGAPVYSAGDTACGQGWRVNLKARVDLSSTTYEVS